MSHLARGPVHRTGIDGKASAVGCRSGGPRPSTGLVEATA